MRLLVVFSVLTFLILAGCVAVTPGANGLAEVSPHDAEAVALATKQKENLNKGVVEYAGPFVFENNSILNRSYNVRGWRDNKSKKFTAAQIYLSIPTSEWVFYSSAFSKGKALDVITIDRRVGYCSGTGSGCSLTEVIGINLSETQLKEYADDGFVGEISGKRGTRQLVIPKEYFAGFVKVFG